MRISQKVSPRRRPREKKIAGRGLCELQECNKSENSGHKCSGAVSLGRKEVRVSEEGEKGERKEALRPAKNRTQGLYRTTR